MKFGQKVLYFLKMSKEFKGLKKICKDNGPATIKMEYKQDLGNIHIFSKETCPIFGHKTEIQIRVPRIDKKTLVIRRMYFINQRAGSGTQAITWIINYARKKGYQNLVVDTASPAMAELCKKFGMHPDDDPNSRNFTLKL